MRRIQGRDTGAPVWELITTLGTAVIVACLLRSRCRHRLRLPQSILCRRCCLLVSLEALGIVWAHEKRQKIGSDAKNIK